MDDSLSSCHPERADRLRCGRSFFAPAHLLETHSKVLGTIHRHHESMGATPEDRDAGRGGLSPSTVRRSRRTERTESERREAPSGRARSTTEVRARRTRSFGDDERCDTRDGRGCTQRTAHGEGPRILSPSNESGERRRSAKAKNTPLSTLHRSLLQEVVRTTTRDPRIRCSRRTPFVSAWKPWRGARCSVSDQRTLHRAPSPCASQRGTPGSGSPGSEPVRSSERMGGT